MAREMVLNGPWPAGINSSLPPAFLPEGSVQWSVNTTNRGGFSTRPGNTCLVDTVGRDEAIPRGLVAFTPKGRNPCLVKAVGPAIRYYDLVEKDWHPLIDIPDTPGPVYFASCIKGTDGGKLIDPYPVLVIQTGTGPPYMWDGVNAKRLDQTEGPTGTVMKWFGSRLWIAVGPRLYASDLLDPFAFTESDTLTGGGYLQFNDNISALGIPSDSSALLVFTPTQTSKVMGAILDRAQWGATAGFQRVLYDNIGCISPRSVINQYGITWWMSNSGLVGLDQAIVAYQSSKIHYRDINMARSRGNFSTDRVGIAMGAFENFLLVAVPSGDTFNGHIWVMDQASLDDINASSPPVWSSCWTGIRPVEFVTVVVSGSPRIFCLSRDYKMIGDSNDWTSNVWEMFTPNRYDIGSNKDGVLVKKSIKCSVETKAIPSKNGGYATFGFAEFLLSGLQGLVHFDSLYATSHSAYKKVLDKDIIASVHSMGNNIPFLDLDKDSKGDFIPTYLPQTRRLKTSEDEARLSDQDDGVEDNYTRNKDRSFSVILKWQGVATLQAIILTLDDRGDQPTGKVEPQEITDRFVSPSGYSKIKDTATGDNNLVAGYTSAVVSSHVSRTPEEFYASVT